MPSFGFFQWASKKAEATKVLVSAIAGGSVGLATSMCVMLYNEIMKMIVEAPSQTQTVNTSHSQLPNVYQGVNVYIPGGAVGAIASVACYLFISKILRDETKKIVKQSPEIIRARLALARITSDTISADMQNIDPQGLATKIAHLIEELPLNMEQLPQDIYCPISHAIMTDPVQTSEGISYERADLQQWYLSGASSCPTDKTQPLVNPMSLPTNVALQRYIYNTLSAPTERHSVYTTPTPTPLQ